MTEDSGNKIVCTKCLQPFFASTAKLVRFATGTICVPCAKKIIVFNAMGR